MVILPKVIKRRKKRKEEERGDRTAMFYRNNAQATIARTIPSKHNSRTRYHRELSSPRTSPGPIDQSEVFSVGSSDLLQRAFLPDGTVLARWSVAASASPARLVLEGWGAYAEPTH